MTVDVAPAPMEETDSDLARVHVTTTDATNTTREYDIKLSADNLDDRGYIMAGSRVDDNAPSEEPAGGGPSQTAYEAAAEYFQTVEGYEVFGR